MRLQNKNGFTLMELLVYMAIVGIVVVIAGQVYSDSTKMRVRTQSMIAANELAEDIGALFRDDVAQMGAKSSIDAGNSTTSNDAFSFYSDVYMAPTGTSPDSSSFFIKNATYDSLAFRSVKYDGAGGFVRVEEISWYLRNEVLYRSCKTISGTADADVCPSEEAVSVALAEGVTSFVVNAAQPNVSEGSLLMFPVYTDANDKSFRFISRTGSDNFLGIGTNPASGAKSVTLSGFSTNFREDGSSVLNPTKHQFFVASSGSTTGTWADCKQLEFKKDSIYEISFKMGNNEDQSRMFQPGKDHFAVGLRIVDETPQPVAGVSDFQFYPPQNDDGTGVRKIQFSQHSEASVSACVAFTFVLYSPTVHNGSLVISDFQVRKAETSKFDFRTTPSIALADKKYVRALRMDLVVKKNKEAGHVTIVVPVQSNGVRG